MLQCRRMIVVDADDLQREVEMRFGKEIPDIRQLFWEGDFMNDCYKHLYFEEDDMDEARDLVYRYLRDEFPDRNSILVDVSW